MQRLRKKKIFYGILLAVCIVAGGMAAWCFLLPRGGYVKGQPDQISYPQSGKDGCPWEYYYRKNADWCSVAGWQWDGDEANMTITVPAEIDGREVRSLSSSDWTIGPFRVLMPEDLDLSGEGTFSTEDVSCIAADDEYITYHFKIILSPDVEETCIRDTWYGRMDEDGESQDVIYKLEYELVQEQ